MLPDISRRKGNQAMKFSQLIEYNKLTYFFKSHAENEAGRLVSDDLLLIFRKALYDIKASGLLLDFSTFR